jgi:predicted aconitase
VALAHEEKARVRGNGERVLRQVEMLGIHKKYACSPYKASVSSYK